MLKILLVQGFSCSNHLTTFFFFSCRNMISVNQFKWYKRRFYTSKIFISSSLSTICPNQVYGEEIELKFIVCVQPFAVLIDILCGLLPVAPSHDALLVGVLFLVQSLFIWSSYENITFGFPKGWREIKLLSIRPRNKLSKVSRTSDFGGSCFHQVARG